MSNKKLLRRYRVFKEFKQTTHLFRLGDVVQVGAYLYEQDTVLVKGTDMSKHKDGEPIFPQHIAKKGSIRELFIIDRNGNECSSSFITGLIGYIPFNQFLEKLEEGA